MPQQERFIGERGRRAQALSPAEPIAEPARGQKVSDYMRACERPLAKLLIGQLCLIDDSLDHEPNNEGHLAAF